MIRILACGHLKEAWLKDGQAEYLKRLQAYDKVKVEEVDDEPAGAKNSEAQNEQVKAREGQRLLKKIRPEDYVILLDLAGRPMDSPAFAAHLRDLRSHGHSSLDFVIGGSLGVSPQLIQRADERWQLSVNTFPHQLCRILVLEQIYRAFRIMRHEPYHK